MSASLLPTFLIVISILHVLYKVLRDSHDNLVCVLQFIDHMIPEEYVRHSASRLALVAKGGRSLIE